MTLSSDIAAHLRARPDGVFLANPSHSPGLNPPRARGGVRYDSAPALTAPPLAATAIGGSAISAHTISDSIATGYIVCEELGE